MHRYSVKINHTFKIKAADEEEAINLAIEELIGLYENNEIDESITVKKLLAPEDDSEPEEENDWGQNRRWICKLKDNYIIQKVLPTGSFYLLKGINVVSYIYWDSILFFCVWIYQRL